MTTKQQIEALFTDDVEARKKAIRDYIMDQSIPYEDRRDIWRRTPDHLRHHDSWVLHLPKFESKYGEISWYDDFYIERHSVMDLRDVEEESRLFLKVRKDWNSGYNKEKFEDFVRECVDLGIHSFTFDW